MTLLVVADAAAGLDEQVTEWVFGWSTRWVGFMRGVWRLTTRPVALVYLLLAVLVWRRPQPAVAMAAAALGSWGLTLLVKEVVGRARPPEALLGAVARDRLGGYGYTSAHTALAAALLVPVVAIIPRRMRPVAGAVAVATVALVATSRVYSGAHFALDVIGGGVLGTVCGFGALIASGSLRRRIEEWKP
ncbi:MAG: phosphatase PAP2 family protein [Actinobacteria bacterium]|nr:MAG: phosphatase PAP2 family protein [Actinomycetota bacterium]